MMPALPPLRRLAVFGVLVIAVLVACGREITGPVSSPVNVLRRAAAFAFEPRYETAVPAHALRAALQQVAFERVRITLRREDGTIALDTVVLFPVGADEMTLTLNVPLPASAPTSGVPLSLNLGYINAAGDTVFKGGPLPVTVTPGTGGAPPPPVQVPVRYTGPGATATAVAISPKSANGQPGQGVNFTAQALSSTGQVMPNTPVVFTSTNPAVVLVDATTGAATFEGRGTAKVYAQLLTGPFDSATVTVTLPAARLELVAGSGQSAPAGTILSQRIAARVVASDGVGVGGVTVTFAAANGGTVTPASAVSASDGSVSTEWRLGPTAGTQAMTVSAAGLTGSPLTVSATARVVTPTRLALGTSPASGTAGVTLAPATVSALDADGAVVATFTGDVTVALGANPGGATLSGTTTVRAVGGGATFNDLRLNRPGSEYTLVFSSTGLASVTSAAFYVVAGPANQLVFTAVPTFADAGAVLAPPVTVAVQDSAGNPVTSFTGAVTIGVGTGPAGALLSGTLTRTAVGGVATFTDLRLTRAGSTTLSAAATGLRGGTSSAISVLAGPVADIIVVLGDGQTKAANSALDPIEVRVTDAVGNGIRGVALTLAVASGGGTVTPTSATTDETGRAALAWTLGPIDGLQRLTVSATGLPTLTVNATATGGSSSALAVTTGPSASQVAGVPLTPSIVVEARNELSAVQTSFTGTVTASILTGPAGATVGGTALANAVAGVVTFNALRLNKTGIYTLQFSAAGYASAVTTSITVGPAAARVVAADSGNTQTGAASSALPQKLVVLVTDSLGNPVPGVAVSWTVATGGGSLAGQTLTTDVNGRARAVWTLGVTPGAQSVTVSSTGLIGSPVTFSATAQGVITTTVVSPQLDTIVSLNATRAVTAQAKDGAGSNMTGAFTWVSRTPSVATVNAAGVVTAVANGSTYIVATEAGGTRDSALIVVQQRVATINVTPGLRSIYKTRNYGFAASAVDGMGNVMPGITSFTWSTITPSVASVDTTGKVTANALGSTQVRATSGAITGVATVNVLTPITRIIVGRDSSGVPVTDSTALNSLGIGRFFRAEARDTLDAPMTGVMFTWSSTNSSVALMDSISATRARTLSNANGVTTIQASADGVLGTTALKVQQQLASIELGPTPNTIGIVGTVQLTARGKDANSRYISGGTFTFASGTPTVATVNAATGVVTGVALGSTNITATSGAVTSNTAVVVVSTTVPAIISFGRDTLTVGRGSSTSIPIFLSRPNASAVTINLAARDTNAYFSTASITIAAGSTAANATLNGRNAGTTQIYATDGGGAGYAGDTAAVAVQANVRMAQTNWYLNATDQTASQVLLSDPSPVGGTYVTFTYGAPGFAQVSPEPAFIPAGQLASNVVITALGSISGNTTITPAATGVNGTASTLNVYAPVLTISAGASARLGAGQFEDGWYVYTPQTSNVAVPLTFMSTDTDVVTVAGTGGTEIPAGSYYRYFKVSAKAPGTALVIIGATGWKPDTLTMTVTSPRTRISNGYSTLNTTSPVASLTVYATDSLLNAHNRTSSLALTMSSSDTSVIRIIDQTPVIAAGWYYNNSIRFQPGGMGGTAWIKVVAGGHVPDSVLVTVVGPKLEFSWSGTRYLGKGQYDQNAYVYSPNTVVSPLTVTLARSDTTSVTVPATVTILAGSNVAYFNIAGIDTAASVSVIASAPGYQGDTSYVRVTSPVLDLTTSGTYNALSPGTNLTVYARDSVGNVHNRIAPLAVSIVSRDTNIVKVDSASVTIPANQYYHNGSRMLPVGTGTTWIVVTAPGHGTDSSQFTVVTPKLNFNFTSALLGRRQYYGPTSFYVYTPDNRATPLAVTITQKNATVDSLSATSLTIPAASYYEYFGIAGMTTGLDTLIASASGYLPDTAFVRVSSPRITASGLPSTALTTSPQGTITVYATDSTGNSHPTLDTLVIRVTSSDTTVLKPTLQYVRIPRGTYYVYTYYDYFGPGTASLTFADSAGVIPGVTTGTVTVTGPSLAFNTGSTMLGMRQTNGSSGYYIYTQNNVASAVTVNLVSTDTGVATVPASVTIPAGSNLGYFGVTARDTVGTIQIQATATGFGPAPPMTVQVTQPKFVISTSSSARTTSGAQMITVYAMDASSNWHYTTEPVTVTLASSSGAVAAVDSLTVTIPAGASYTQAARWTPVAVGTAQLSATDDRAAIYKYSTATYNVSVVVPNVSFNYGTDYLGLGQYTDGWYVQSQDNLAAGATVALGHVGPTRATIPATTTIPAGTNYSYFRVVGTARGTDTLTANIASPLHNPGAAYVVVDSGRVDTFSGWPSASLAVGDSVLVTLYARDPNGNARNVLAATTFAISAGSGLEIHRSNAVVTSVTVPADGNSVQFYVKATAAGTPSATFTNANYRTYTPPNVTVIP